jgi:hypothetical protein
MNIIWIIFNYLVIQIFDVEIDVAFNFIYIMHYNGLVILLQP